MNVCEVYTSVQGEGPNTGKPITFVRFGGCNLRCPGWGTGHLPDGTEVPGCDTVFAVYPEWRDTWDSRTPLEVRSLVPDSPRMVCLTGGEPLIQRSKDMVDLVQLLLQDSFTIDLFTNGSQLLPSWTALNKVTVIMDWKLPGSGEGGTFNVENLERLYPKDAIKFVVKNRVDFDVALEHIAWAKVEKFLDAQVWFGPVWNEMDPSELAVWVQEEYPNGRMNLQTHKYIWHPDERKR